VSCHVCAGKGIVKVGFRDGSPANFAVCLCPAGRWYRSDVNIGKRTGHYGWEVWAAREQVPIEQVCALEDLYDAPELAQMGFQTAGNGETASREALLLEAGKTRKRRL